MHVVYFCQYFVTPSMAGSTRAYEFSRRLVADGHSVHVITSDQKGGPRRKEEIEGVQVTWIPVRYSNDMGFVRRILAFLMFAVLASIEGAKSRPTVVFATSTPLTIIFPALVTKWIRRVPMVFEVRDLWPELPIAIGALNNPILIKIASWMERLAYSQSRRVIALSPGMKDGVVATGYPENQVVVVPNSSDVARFTVDKSQGEKWLANQSWSRGGPIVLYAGTLGQINGVEYLADVAAAAAKIGSNIDFVVIGAGRMEHDIRTKAAGLEVLGKNFHMLKQMPKEEMPLLYNTATVSVSLFLPIKEMEHNSANKFFDALASGTPVALNYGGWQLEVLKQHDCGIRMSSNPETAAEEIIAFVDRVRADDSVGQRALQLAQDEFDRDKLYERFSQTILSAAS